MTIYHLISETTQECILCGKSRSNIVKDWEYYLLNDGKMVFLIGTKFCNYLKKEPDILKEIYG